MKKLTHSQIKSLTRTIISAVITVILCCVLYCYYVYCRPSNLDDSFVVASIIITTSISLGLFIINASEFHEKLRHPDEVL